MKQQRSWVRAVALGVGVVALSASPARALDLTGQSVCATWGTTARFAEDPQTPFVCNAVVGPGTEFTGGFVDVFDHEWSIGLDVFATGFALYINEITEPNFGNVRSTSALSIELTGLSGIGAISLSAYTCAPANQFSCTTFDGGPSITTLTSDATSAFVDLNTIRSGETYVFSLSDGVVVPEPTSAAMIFAGLALLGLAGRSRKRVM